MGSRPTAASRAEKRSAFRPTSLHGCAELPGRELLVAEAELLALGLLAARRGKDEVEDPLADLLHRRSAVGDGAAIDIHSVGHALIERGIGRELEARCRLAAEDRAEPGSEADDVAAARHLARG